MPSSLGDLPYSSGIYTRYFLFIADPILVVYCRDFGYLGDSCLARFESSISNGDVDKLGLCLDTEYVWGLSTHQYPARTVHHTQFAALYGRLKRLYGHDSRRQSSVAIATDWAIFTCIREEYVRTAILDCKHGLCAVSACQAPEARH